MSTSNVIDFPEASLARYRAMVLDLCAEEGLDAPTAAALTDEFVRFHQQYCSIDFKLSIPRPDGWSAAHQDHLSAALRELYGQQFTQCSGFVLGLLLRLYIAGAGPVRLKASAPPPEPTLRE